MVFYYLFFFFFLDFLTAKPPILTRAIPNLDIHAIT
jgi:hypothetical protein